jgi:Zn finger protein HypA/HybF involved in hydrogenase expression
MIQFDNRVSNMHSNEADHLADAMYYWRTIVGTRLRNYMHAEQKSYACECKHCEITLYTSMKRLNCEYCGTSDPGVFTCTELKE